MKRAMRIPPYFLILALFFILPGCYTQLATVEHDGYYADDYDREEQAQDTTVYDDSTGYTEDEYQDESWRPRRYIGFDYYYPWGTSIYWGYGWHSSFFYDPWLYDRYDPWFAHYYPYYYYPYSFWSPRYYYRGYSSGYYAYYQPYMVNRTTVRRESGYRRNDMSRDGYTRNAYGTRTGYTATTPSSGSSRTESATRSRSKETGAVRGSSTETTRSRNASTDRGSSRGNSSYQPRTRETRSSGATRSGSSRTEKRREQSSYNPPSHSSPPSSSTPPSSSRGSSGSSGGSNRSSGGSRGNR